MLVSFEQNAAGLFADSDYIRWLRLTLCSMPSSHLLPAHICSNPFLPTNIMPPGSSSVAVHVAPPTLVISSSPSLTCDHLVSLRNKNCYFGDHTRRKYYKIYSNNHAWTLGSVGWLCSNQRPTQASHVVSFCSTTSRTIELDNVFDLTA